MPVYELQVDPQATVDVWISPAAFPPGTARDDVLAIRPAEVGKGKAKDRPLLYKVDKLQADDDGEQNSQNARRRGKAQVVVASNIASSFPWIKNRQDVFVTLVDSPPPTELAASHVELYFKDLYLSRPDMFRLTVHLASTVLHLNQRVVLPGSLARLRVGEIFNQEGHTVRSAWVDEDTKIVFRSESARCYVLVEISQEMWQFEEDGSMLREKCDVFLHELFAHWTGQATSRIDSKSKGNPTSHTVSIILYGRVIYDDYDDGEEERAPIRRLEDGTLYRDFYKVILDLTPSPSPSIVRAVAAEIRSWQETVLTRTRPSGELKLAGRIAFAHESPVLEATNIALNTFEEHWVDRDLQRTGFEVIVLTAGTSYYEVQKSLLRLTTERMLYHGVGLDLISLSKTPLHTVPLFSFRSHDPSLSESIGSTKASGVPLTGRRDLMSAASGATHATGAGTVSSMAAHSSAIGNAMSTTPSRNTPLTRTMVTRDSPRDAIPDDQRDPLYYDPVDRNRAQETSVYYAEPLFIFCSFFGTQIDKPHRIDRFMPRARCYQLFSQGPSERVPIAIPFLPTNTMEQDMDDEGWGYLSELERRQARRERYDAAAVGAKDGGDAMAMWRKSGVTSQTSGDSLSKSRDSESGVEVEEELSRRTTALGLAIGHHGRRRAARTVSEAIVSTRQEHERDRDTERGRGERMHGARGTATSSRSLTPVPNRTPRPGSVAPSVRSTEFHANKIADGQRKVSTPALIARLTAQASGSNASTPAATSSRPGGWLGFFNRTASGTTAAPAPSVAVQKVEAQANVKPEFDLEGDQSVTSRQSIRSLSPSSVSRQSVSSRPTQPIQIGSKADSTKGPTDRITKLPRSSPSAKIYGHSGASRKSSSRVFGARFNPSKPGRQSRGLADQARRWASIFIRHSNDQRSVNWVSVTRGACLPLTTDYLPPLGTLSHQFSEHRYSIPTTDLDSSFLLKFDDTKDSPVLALVVELVSQRLSHGFQLVTPANNIGAFDELNIASSKTLPEVLRDIRDGESTPIHLTLSTQIHRISYDRRTQSVLVRIMRRRRSWLKETYEYAALVWTQGAPRYSQLAVDFPYPNMIDPTDWQHLDRLIAGAETVDLRPSLRFWRTRLVLLPAEHVPDRDYIISRNKALQGVDNPSDSMIQNQGFQAFMESIEGARWTAPGSVKEEIPITHTSLSAPEWAVSIARGSASDAHKDGKTVVQPRTTSGWLSRFKMDDSGDATPTADHSRSPSRDDSASKPTVHMSYAIILDLDPTNRSPRSERVLCHLDRSHNVEAAYHLELNWLAGSGKIIDQAIQSWTRQVARFGLNLVEIGSKAVEDRYNPFQQAMRVPLALSPPEGDEYDPPLPKCYFEEALLRSLHFFLDVGADSTFPPTVDVQYSYRRTPTPHSQFIHRTGSVLVAVLGGRGGFAYIPNRIYTSHHPETARVEDVVATLRGVCSNPQALQRVWEDARRELERTHRLRSPRADVMHSSDEAGLEYLRA